MRHTALALALVLVACGGNETGSSTPPIDPDGTIAFVDGFEAAAKQAASEDDVVFVYVGRHKPT